MTDRRPSWLELEQLLLGELPAERAESIRAWLDSDPEVAAALQRIEQDPPVVLPPLPPVPERRMMRSWIWPAMALGAAGLLLLTLGDHGAELRTKGADSKPIISLVAERDGRVRPDPERIQTGDRLRLLSTFDGDPVAYDVVVREGTLSSFPLERGRLPRGNRVPLPGAFRIEAAGKIQVCLVTGPDLPSRRTLSRRRTKAEVCIEVPSGPP